MRRLLAVAFCLAAVPLVAQELPEFPGDPGPPYQFKVVDLVFRIDDIAGAIQAMEVKETDTEVRVDLAADVLFDFDKADLLPKAEETLQRAADFVKERNKAAAVVRIEGHTDAKGSDSYNRKLSLRRADSVKRWLTSHGLSAMRFSTEGFGATKPVAPNQKPDGSDDPVGRQKNRRVEIVIQK
ncbi:MAG TPA: OmpA family protein [Thermoanaerobaculia bacterium]|nr:OmpA family protein [Thermoanaerobaculia bacterium]